MLPPVVVKTTAATLRIAVVPPDTLATDADAHDSAAESEAQRSR